MTRKEVIGDAELWLGDCRDDLIVASEVRRKPWGKTPIKPVVSCRECDWTWKPVTGFGHERCPNCGKVCSVRDRSYEKNIASLKLSVKRKRSSGEWERIYRRRAVLLVSGANLNVSDAAATARSAWRSITRTGAAVKNFRQWGISLPADSKTCTAG